MFARGRSAAVGGPSGIRPSRCPEGAASASGPCRRSRSPRSSAGRGSSGVPDARRGARDGPALRPPAAGGGAGPALVEAGGAVVYPHDLERLSTRIAKACRRGFAGVFMRAAVVIGVVPGASWVVACSPWTSGLFLMEVTGFGCGIVLFRVCYVSLSADDLAASFGAASSMVVEAVHRHLRKKENGAARYGLTCHPDHGWIVQAGVAKLWLFCCLCV